MPNPHERFTALYTTYQARVYGYAASRAGRQLAEEVVSETFLMAWRRLDDIPDHAQLPWLLRFARNILRDGFRQTARRESLEAELRTWLEEAADAGDHATERVAVLTPSRANQELFDLAGRIEKLPAGGGAYWREAAVDDGHLFSGGYTLTVVDRRETWQPRDPADPVLMRPWRGSARPATAADERRWRAAGSPARVKGYRETGSRAVRCRSPPNRRTAGTPCGRTPREPIPTRRSASSPWRIWRRCPPSRPSSGSGSAPTTRPGTGAVSRSLSRSSSPSPRISWACRSAPPSAPRSSASWPVCRPPRSWAR
ncbi:RNA polymerase sigma factor [Planomonospora parontospora]|uniref:RNA polymerase sigma factor n=1 Tax=Planomonospora parontospora TaxID=58119 RepID=UPI001EF5CBF2|nr:sigma-70 family RNA polymerase sigma factor [Planomonospora parontospora]